MKTLALLLAATLLAACNAAPDASTATTPATPAPAAAPTRATATGVVQSIDTAAKTITIAHGPVAALGWPGMTMTFQAPHTDLSTLQAGDKVTFEFDSTGMDGTIVAITRQ